MANDMDINISLQGQNNASGTVDAVDSSLAKLGEIANTLTSTFRDFGNIIERVMNQANQSIESATRPMQDNIIVTDNASKAMDTLGKSATDAGKGIDSAMSTASKAIADVAKPVADDTKALEDMVRSMGSIDKAASEAGKTMVSAFQGAENEAKQLITEVDKADEKLKTMGTGGGAASKGNGGMFGIQGQMDSMYAGMSMGAASLPIVGVFKEAIKTFGDFDQAIANTNSMMGMTPPQIDAIKQQIMELSKTVPDGPVALANALYGVVGAGVPAADAMSVLTTASKAATAGQTDVSTATGALIAVMNSYGLSAKDIGTISDQMFAANAAGAMTFTDLAKSIGNVAGPAAQAGVGFDQVSAATAALTSNGMTAQRATEGLRALLVGIMAPTKIATKEAANLGIEWDQNALKSKGLTGMLQEAMQATGGNSEELKKLIPNIAAWTVAVNLGGKGAQSFTNALNQMGQSTGATDRAMTAQEQGFTEKVNKMKAAVQSAQITFVTSFAPVITKVAEDVTKLAQAFANLSPETQKTIAYIAGGAAAFLIVGSAMFMTISSIGSLISGFRMLGGAFAITKTVAGGAKELTMFGSVLKGLGSVFMTVGRLAVTGIRMVSMALISNPIILLIAAIVAVVAFAAYEIYTHWAQISAFLRQTWQNISTTATSVWNSLKSFFSGLWSSIVQGTRNAWNSTVSYLNGVWNNIKTSSMNAWNSLVTGSINTWNRLVNGIRTLWTSFVNWIRNAAQSVANAVIFAFQWMYNHNYYFQNLVDFIKKAWNMIVQTTQTVWTNVTQFLMNAWISIVNTGKAIWNTFINYMAMIGDWEINLFQTTWNMIWGFLVSVWNTISSTAQSVWNAVANFFVWLWNTVSSTAQAVWNSIVNFFIGLWNGAVSTAQAIWNPISSFFVGLWNTISSAASSAWNWIVSTITENATNAVNSAMNIFNGLGNFFSGLWGQAKEWGANLIHMVAEGITSAAGQVADAAKGVAQNIASFLGFHSPAPEGPAGPGQSDKWMGNLMNMFANDIEQHTPQLQAVIKNVALGIKTGFTMPMNQNFSQNFALPAAPTSSGNVTIIVQANGNVTRNERELGKIVSQAILDQVKLQGKIS